jgi:hypothetical protein
MMTQSGETRVIEAIIKLEVKLDHVIARLENGDNRFADLEKRVQTIEQKQAQFMAVIMVVAFIVPIILRFVFPV